MRGGGGWNKLDCFHAVLFPLAQFLSPSSEWPDTPAAEMEKSRRALAAGRHLAVSDARTIETALAKLRVDEPTRAALRDWVAEVGPVDAEVVARYEARLLAA